MQGRPDTSPVDLIEVRPGIELAQRGGQLERVEVVGVAVVGAEDPQAAVNFQELGILEGSHAQGSNPHQHQQEQGPEPGRSGRGDRGSHGDILSAGEVIRAQGPGDPVTEVRSGGIAARRDASTNEFSCTRLPSWPQDNFVGVHFPTRHTSPPQIPAGVDAQMV